MTVATVRAQAKVNLALRILAREEDGYHQIETMFQRLALADSVTVRASTTRSLDITWTDPARATALGPVERNLAWRAAEAYAAVGRWPSGFAIEIEKSIPVGGGLGGGSADAAAVLRALDTLSPRPLGQSALLDIATRLGADVAFLTSPSERALAWGRGERLFELPPLPTAPVVLVVPSFGVDTADAYRALAAHRAAEPRPAAAAWRSRQQLDNWDAIATNAVNDFEPVVFDQHPELATMRAQLASSSKTIFAMMSGSGSTLFAVLHPGSAATVDRLILPSGWAVVRTTTAPTPQLTRDA